jgi:outer membrane protein TolC
MNLLYRSLFCLFLCFGYCFQSVAQGLSNAAQNAPLPTQQDDLYLPVLDSLYQWAEETSFSMKIQDALIDKTGADTKRIKKQWLDAFKFSANLRGGSYGNAVVNQVETGYSFGPSVSFSLYELSSRKNLVAVYRAEEKVAVYKKEEVRFELRKWVAILYTNISSQKNILKIKSEALNAAYVHMKMAEKQFNQGAVELGELSRVEEIYAKAQTEQELTIQDLRNYYMQLEQLCGRSFN